MLICKYLNTIVIVITVSKILILTIVIAVLYYKLDQWHSIVFIEISVYF